MELRWSVRFNRATNDLVVRLEEYDETGQFNECIGVAMRDFWFWHPSEKQLEATILKMQTKLARRHIKQKTFWETIKRVFTRMNQAEPMPHLKVVQNESDPNNNWRGRN